MAYNYCISAITQNSNKLKTNNLVFDMKLKPKEIKKLKIYLALQGSGSRKKLAEKLGLQMSNLSAYISKGQFPDKYVPMINELLK